MTDSERLARLEAMVEAIAKKLCVELVAGADEKQHCASFERVVAELAAGNKKPLQQFKRRGGKIPC